ncbi:unnamed protein product, partial [Prunus brigantina]
MSYLGFPLKVSCRRHSSLVHDRFCCRISFTPRATGFVSSFSTRAHRSGYSTGPLGFYWIWSGFDCEYVEILVSAMSVLSWNVQGLGNRCTFHDLRNLLQDKTPYIVFLIETRMTAVQMGGLVRRLGVGGVLCVPCEGFFGDLYILWKTSLQVVLLSSSFRHIDARVDIGPWMCCGDFNEILSADEKSGPHLCSVGQIEDENEQLTTVICYQ